MIRASLLAATLALTGCAAPDYRPDYIGLQGNIGVPQNTHNDDRHEASSEASPALAGMAGWTVNDWLAVEGRAAWWHQRAHGYNPHGPDFRESVNGTFDAVTLQGCPVVSWPGLWAKPYARACVGPGYAWGDTTRSSITGQRSDFSRTVLAYEGALGIEREIGGGVAARLEGGYASADPIEQLFAGAALVYRFEVPGK